MGYRADLDGLRCLAIVLVVAYHVHVPGFSGGFVGVDVFFVVSGFLITGLLMKELAETGRVSLFEFYARRTRRLLPALTVVMLATLVLGTFVLVPEPELRTLGQSAFAAAIFASNVLFWANDNDYFAPGSELRPLLHTWSLAVEEQFYIVWPLMLMLIGALTRRASARTWRIVALSAISIAGIGSFAYAARTVDDDVSAAFFLLPSRLWELAAGGAIALVVHRVHMSAVVAGAAAAGGLAAIGLSVELLDDSSVFPGPAALPVVVGTGVVVAAGARGVNAVSRALAWAPLVRIGRLSYSWYLVHWPLLVLARVHWLGVDLARDTAIGVGSLGVAALLYRYVEQPIRHGRVRFATGRNGSLKAGLAAIACVAAAGLVVGSQAGALSRVQMSSAEAAALAENRTARLQCPQLAVGFADPVDCRFAFDPAAAGADAGGGDPRTIALVGDSQALALLPAARRVADELGVDVEVLWSPGCPYVDRYDAPPGALPLTAACARENRIRHDYLLTHADRMVAAVITGHGSTYLPSDGDGSATDAWARSLAVTLTELADAGLDVVVMYDVPSFEHMVPSCLVRSGPDTCDLARSEAEIGRRASLAAEQRAVAAAGVVGWDPFDALCGARVCATTRAGAVLYRDRHHLSTAGAMVLAPEFEAHLRSLHEADRRGVAAGH